MAQQKEINFTRNLLYGAILVLVLLIGLYFIQSMRILSLETKWSHFGLEVAGFILAMMAGTAAFRQLKSTKSSFYLFIALAFLGNGFEDVVHAFAAIGIFGSPTSGQSVFIPATWTVGRIIFALLLLSAIRGKERKLDTQFAGWITRDYFTPIAMVVLAFTTVILLFPVPAFILVDFPPFLRRPYELLAIVPLLIALPMFLSKMRKKETHWASRAGTSGTFLFLSMITGIFVGIYMMNSIAIFDVYFNWAHILKDVSYLFFALALTAGPSATEVTTTSMFRFSIGRRLYLGFGAMTLVSITLVLTAFAVDKGYVVHEISRYIWFLAFVTVFFGIVYPWVLVKRVTSQVATMDAISKGDAKMTPQDATPDEIGDMIQAFNRMGTALKFFQRGGGNKRMRALHDELVEISKEWMGVAAKLFVLRILLKIGVNANTVTKSDIPKFAGLIPEVAGSSLSLEGEAQFKKAVLALLESHSGMGEPPRL